MAVLRHRHTWRYAVYMRSSLWSFRRWLWFVTSRRRCEDCGCQLVLHVHHAEPLGGGPRRQVLTVHHLSYRLRWWPLRDPRSNVRLLCWPCHRKRDEWRYR